MHELAALDGIAHADLVRRGEITEAEALEAAIARIEAGDADINSVVDRLFDKALAEAATGKSAGAEANTGALVGAPFLAKDFVTTIAGVKHCEASAFLDGYVAPDDSVLAKRWKRAGLRVLGVTNAPEFSITSTTEPALYGPCRNPWDLTRTAGGSSGGAAAAVAARFVPIAHASDSGGSIRVPASCCGVFGLKPTRARNPLDPSWSDIHSRLLAEHAVTISVRDSAALLDETCGSDPGDPYAVPSPRAAFLEEVRTEPARLRVAFTAESPTGTPVCSDAISAVQDAAALCEELGHEVVEGGPCFDAHAVEDAVLLLVNEVTAWMADAWSRVSGRVPAANMLEPRTWEMRRIGSGYTVAEHLGALEVLHEASRDFARFFDTRDVWLTPTLAEPPVPLGTFDAPPDEPLGALDREMHFTPFTAMVNATGVPAMSVPLYWNDANLPIGTQFIGRFGDEATLFRLAGQLETARPWAARIPPTQEPAGVTRSTSAARGGGSDRDCR